ncbi:YfbM family protein [Gemelliphila palaticanis]|uniref:YfbM family protein n=1 Tax=Gemelliphila palaticanis TaxID=81950 RepID=A0ABX2SZ18_9BACL|nr:YfbM family protein [Gemella palaticanis]MBF0715685.1 YfbM family protein [Gemella palaticanis]NYS47615.1 YfbM family protein [Gemella palaticanis]
MGMYANYMYLSDKNLLDLKSFENDEVFENVEDWDEEAELSTNIDKMWDVLHFVFTGVGSNTPIKNHPLSEAIVGVNALEEVAEFVAYIEKSRVKEIVSALESFDFEKSMKDFSMQACKNANLYPAIWDYEEEKDEIIEELTEYFGNLKEFYEKILKINGNVLVTIY